MKIINNILKIDKTPAIVLRVIDFLNKEGHICAKYNGKTLKWCCQNICADKFSLQNMELRNDKEEQFAQKLKSQGHKCVIIMECYPIRVSWCQQNICVKK